MAHHLVLVVERPREGADGAPLAAIRERDGRVAHEPGALGPPEGGTAEARSKRALVELEQA